jgi:hypothetical protein
LTGNVDRVNIASMNVETVSVSRRRTHASLPERVDVAIVGSGLGGLVAGANC